MRNLDKFVIAVVALSALIAFIGVAYISIILISIN